jgi:hypothetical protein
MDRMSARCVHCGAAVAASVPGCHSPPLILHTKHTPTQVRHDILDWHGDHPHTNYHDMYDALRWEAAGQLPGSWAGLHAADLCLSTAADDVLLSVLFSDHFVRKARLEGLAETCVLPGHAARRRLYLPRST